MRQILLPHGRKMGYAEYGVPGGYPVIYCHGFPGSRLEAQLLRPAVERLGVYVIAPDRPGYGGSDPSPGRSLGDFAHDVVALLDCLKLSRVGVLGVSGGGPYALSLLAAYPERTSRAALVGALGRACDILACRSAFSPIVRRAWDVAQHASFAMPFLAWAAMPILTRFGLLTRLAAPADLAVLSDPVVRDILTRSQREGLRQGGRGAARDFALYSQSWGFALSDVHTPVTIWHGQADKVVPVQMAARLAEGLPRACTRILDAEGHYSLPIRYSQAIIESVLCDGTRS